jgi:hypothetical protein
MTDTNEAFETEVANLVIRPKLQKVVEKYEVSSKAELRKWFLIEEEVTLSAAKFDEYLKLLGITFKKQVVIEGLYTAASSASASGRKHPTTTSSSIMKHPKTQG